MALASNNPKGPAAVWKHIGLYGYTVGTFTADPSAIQWKSSTSSKQQNEVVTTRLIPGRTITSALWTIFGRSAHIRISAQKNSGTNTEANDKYLSYELRFDGFPPSDFDKLKSVFSSLYNVDLLKHTLSASGASFGKTDISGRHLVFRQCIVDEEEEEGEDGDEMLSIDLGEVSQCVLPGNNRNEIELQFHESDINEKGTDQLVQIRFYVPPSAGGESDGDGDNDPDASTAAELFQQKIMTKASIKNTTGNIIAELDESKGTFLTPRGRYTIELYDSFMRMRGNKYDYKIKYDDISKLFLLPKSDEVHMAFVIALDRPIRQGQQRYQFLVLQTTKEQSELHINLDEETLAKEYRSELQPVMTGSLSNLVAKTFKVITGKRVFIPGKFVNSNTQPCVKCALRANDGHLYPLEKQLIFIHKPPVLIRFSDIESVEFQRYAGGQGSTRNFDLSVTLTSDAAGDTIASKEYTFSGIDRSDYAPLFSFLSNKKIQIQNSYDDAKSASALAGAVQQEEMRRMQAEMADEGSSGEDDDDYNEGQNSSESDSSASGSDSDEDLAEVVDESDLDTPIKKKSKKEKVKEKSSSKYAPSAPKTKQGVRGSESKKRKSLSSTTPPSQKADSSSSSKKKSKKDKNAPKKPLTSYMLFMSTMRSKIKEQNPDMNFADLSRAVAKDFKALTPDGKQKYEDMAKADKERYANEMKNYTPPSDEEVDEKRKKDPNAPKRGLTAYNFFCREMREKVKEENPDASFGDLSRIVGGKYKSLSEEELKKWNAKAKLDQVRYKEEMKDYVPAKNTSSGKKSKPIKDKNAPKKNLTSYLLFAGVNREKIKQKNPDLSFADLSRSVGQQFKSLSAEDREKWNARAEKDKERYTQEMKEYQKKKAAETAATAAASSSEEESDGDGSSSEEESGSGGGGSGSDSDDSNSS